MHRHSMNTGSTAVGCAGCDRPGSARPVPTRLPEQSRTVWRNSPGRPDSDGAVMSHDTCVRDPGDRQRSYLREGHPRAASFALGAAALTSFLAGRIGQRGWMAGWIRPPA